MTKNVMAWNLPFRKLPWGVRHLEERMIDFMLCILKGGWFMHCKQFSIYVFHKKDLAKPHFSYQLNISKTEL
jgi:hypothetical protein